MKLKSLLAATLSIIICVSAYPARPDVRTRMSMRRTELSSKAAEDETPRYIPFIIELKSDDISELDSLEAVVFHRRGRLVLACVPEINLDRLFRSEYIDAISSARRSDALLDVARKVTGADMLHAGITFNSTQTGEKQSFDGTGVIAGIVDIGFDPNHTAFADRLVYWSLYDEQNAVRQEYDGPDAIRTYAPETDNPEETHATHVLNIMAGGYMANPYYGVAKGADIAVSTSGITDVGILAGIEDIVAVAEREGKPCVINVSCGSYLGPHDGTDLFNRYLAAINDRALVCFSAGNYGHRDISLIADLDNLSQPLSCTWCDTRKWDGFEVYGSSDFWSSGPERFDIRYIIYDVQERRFVYQSDWYGSSEDGEILLNIKDIPEVADLFAEGGYVYFGWGVDPNNGRFNVSADYNSSTSIQSSDGPWARYFTGFSIRPVDNGIHFTAWADGSYSYFHANGVPGNVLPTNNNSATNFANGDYGVVIGAWNSRNLTPLWGSENMQDHGFEVNRVASWSACGETFSGRRLPDICAPGNTLVSAMSTPYYNTVNNHPSPACVSDDSYWYAEAGTSMSSPMVAGIVAGWLQLYPGLTTANLRDIFARTAARTFVDIDEPRWGPGAVDAEAGLREVKAIADELSVDNISCDGVITEMYNLQGFLVNAEDVTPGTVVIMLRTNPLTGQTTSEKVVYGR